MAPCHLQREGSPNRIQGEVVMVQPHVNTQRPLGLFRMNLVQTNSLFPYRTIYCVAGKKWLHIHAQHQWQQVPRETLGRWPSSWQTWIFHWDTFFDTQGQKRVRQAGDMCPLWEFTMQMVLSAAHPWVPPVIFHGLNGSAASQVWAFLSPPSVASPAATQRALSSVTSLQSMPRTAKLKRKFVMTYIQMTACKYFRKWSEYDEKYMTSHFTFPQAMGTILSWFQGGNFERVL